MVWNGRVSVHDFYETTRIFYEKDYFSVSDTGDSEEKNPGQLACVMTSQQIVLCKLDHFIRTTHWGCHK